MGSSMIDGYGEIHFRHPNLGLFPGGFAEIEVNPSISTADAKRYTVASGESIVSDSRITLSKYELTVKQQTLDFRSFEMSAGESAELADATYYELIEAVVPLESPYTIELPASVSDAPTGVMVTIFDNGSWNLSGGTYGKQKLTNLGTTGTPTIGQFKVDVTAPSTPELTFNSAQAGAPVNISYPKTATSKLTLGIASNPQFFTGAPLLFSMKLISDAFPNGVIFICPSIAKISGFGLKSADVAEIEHKFTIGIAAGKRTPFELIEL